MFKGDSADMCGGKFLLFSSMRRQGARTPIGASGIHETTRLKNISVRIQILENLPELCQGKSLAGILIIAWHFLELHLCHIHKL